MARAQTSLELTILTGFLLVVIFGFFVVFEYRIRDEQRLQRQLEYDQLSAQVESELLLAARVQTGYSRAFGIVPVIGGLAYTARLEGADTLIINQSEVEYLRFLGANVSIITYPGDPHPEVLLVPASYTILVQRALNGSVLVRKDCVANGFSVQQCAVI